MTLKQIAFLILLRVQATLNVLLRPLTLGVRAIVIDDQDQVFLVRHSYVPGWHLPGGGVEAGETALEAATRELQEEGNIEITAPPQLLGVFHHVSFSRRDHVLVYVVRGFRQTAARGRDWEIVETGFFPRLALPQGVTAATRDRLAEFVGEQPISERW